MHPVGEVPPVKRFAPAVGVHAAAAGNDEAQPVAPGVVEAPEQRLPAREAVQLVEEHHGKRLGQPVGAESGGEAGRTGQDQLAVGEVVPVAAGVGVAPAGDGLADMPGSADERHRAARQEVLQQHGVVDGEPPPLCVHYLVNRIMVETVLCYIIFWSEPAWS